ncbi:VOC family protein [Flavobacterium sp. SM15]|uniref:VOC family protein n=1 Tax=Flavobacterium sp. SM15 TaxID=2908005 RepID=UPI001EDC3F07|nr:VOC family protein [Flavobacterium sp. SM15]MCG2610487.1 VOC family protein [Flavobacterium sp. SM15]
MKNPIYPCLWFNTEAKEAADFYCTVFEDSKITASNPIVSTFEASGQKFMCLNGGPMFSINPSISFFAVCETEAEVDNAWSKLTDNGKVLMPLDAYPWSQKYGWVQDKFGVNWQLSFGKFEEVGQKFTPTLMFTQEGNGKATEAINFYTSLFPNSDIKGILRFDENDHGVPGTVKHAQFTLNNNVFMAMDGGLGHDFSFNEGVSLVIECEDQQEIDYFWNKLTENGQESMCGWLKDQYGVSWQVVPEILGELMNDPEKGQRVVQAFLKMKKFDIETLVNA